MAETVTIDLSSHIDAFLKLTAEWWEENSKFVVIRGATKKDADKFALRLDLDKRAFLDHVDNERTDKLVQSQAKAISELVWSERLKRINEHVALEHPSFKMG
jgi:hypothetical protein